MIGHKDWGRAVDKLLRRDWCLSVVDAGIDDEQLSRAWIDGETPEAFVAWFAEKYDLIQFDAWGPKSRAASTDQHVDEVDF